MKRLCVIVFSVISLVSHSQTIIKSSALDSAIYQKISEERVKHGLTPLKMFLYGEVREFSYTVTKSNLHGNFDHSPMDSSRRYCNAECIARWTNNLYTTKLTSGKYDIQVHPEMIDVLATQIVNQWVNSPSHFRALMRTWNEKVTITTVLEISEDYTLTTLSASYHSVQTTRNKYEIPEGLWNNVEYYLDY
jgi:hypothetical protein